MEPAAFRIRIGMSEHEVRQRFSAASIDLVEGEETGELTAEYEDGKTVTLQFERDRLVSARFELIDFLTVIETHWQELSARLQKRLGPPTLAPDGLHVLIWQEQNPQVMAALSRRRDDGFGKQGLGFAVVRYFEAPPAATPATGAENGR